MIIFRILRHTKSTAGAGLLALACLFTGNAANAQGLMPVPDISGATVTSEAVLVSGSPWGGQYEYRYTIESPTTATGTIWLLKVDVSAQERQGENAFPAATYPVQGGAQFAPMIDEVEELAPFFGLRGPEVMVVGQQAPSGWDGGLNIQGYVQFAASDTSFGVPPGATQSGFVINFQRPPTIRQMTLTPHWVLMVDDHSTVTEEELNAAVETEDTLPVTVEGLGPLDIDYGGWQHYSRLFNDIARAEFLGWASDPVFVDSIEAALGSAQDNAFIGNNGLAQADLESIYDIFNAADPSIYRPEFRQLVELNVAALIQILPSAFNTFIPVFTATPERADLEKRDTYTLTMRYFNSALEGEPPLSGLRILVRCVADYPCANAGDLTPGTALQFDATGELQFSYVGENLGTDFIEIVENDNEAFQQLAIVQVNWTADADLVVPAFVPPIIFASEGESIFVSDRTENIGTKDVLESTVTRYYISDVTPVDIGTATVLGERVVPALAAGAGDDSFEVEFTIPAGFTEEVNYLAACADADDVVAELDEDNNCSFSELVRQFDAVGFLPDNPVILPTVDVLGASQAEGDTGTTVIEFEVSISQADPAADISLTFSTTDGTATAGSDYESVNQQVVFTAGTTELTQLIPVTVFGDFDVELDETFSVELTGVSVNAQVGTGSAEGTIENDDLVAVSIADVAALEGDAGTTAFTFAVTIDQPHPAESVSVNLETFDGTALQGVDYASAMPFVQFGAAAAQLTQNVTIDVIGDTDIEADEDFLLVISSVSANASILDATGVGTILNDDLPLQLDCTSATASPGTLWPPNHKLVDITLAGVFDADGDPSQIVVTGIEQDEPVDGLGDGDTSPDGFGVGTDTPQLRRERSGTGDGRVYFISFEATDVDTGATCTGVVSVGVPHDQGQGSTPIDSGVRYDSTSSGT